MSVRVAVVFVASLLFLSGCATPPKTYDFDPVAVVDADFDTVWSTLVEYFAISSLPIQTIEKDSGLIVTSWMNASSGYGEADERFCDCGGAGLAITHWTRGKFNVFAKSVGDGRTQLRVTCTYQQHRELLDTYGTVSCVSTGFLECQLHEYVRAKVGGGAVPPVPTFAPGEMT